MTAVVPEVAAPVRVRPEVPVPEGIGEVQLLPEVRNRMLGFGGGVMMAIRYIGCAFTEEGETKRGT